MPFGKTLELKQFTRVVSYRKLEPRETVFRDRSLRGRKRIKARKAKQRSDKK